MAPVVFVLGRGDAAQDMHVAAESSEADTRVVTWMTASSAVYTRNP